MAKGLRFGIQGNVDIWMETTWGVEEFGDYIDKQSLKEDIKSLRFGDAAVFERNTKVSLEKIRRNKTNIYIPFKKILFVQEWSTKGGDSETE